MTLQGTQHQPFMFPSSLLYGCNIPSIQLSLNLDYIEVDFINLHQIIRVNYNMFLYCPPYGCSIFSTQLSFKPN